MQQARILRRVLKMDLVPLLLIGGAIILVFVVAGRGLALGRLPGDISGSRGRVKFYAPLATSILISIVLTLVLNAAVCGLVR